MFKFTIIISATLVLAMTPVTSADITELDTNTAVITNSTTETEEMTADELQLLYSGDVKKFSNGRDVILIHFKNGSIERNIFIREFLGMHPRQYDRLIRAKKHAGRYQTSPVIVNSTQEMIQRVEDTENAIGYVSRDTIWLYNHDNKNFKKIKIVF